ncbi:MoxR family ATPase [Phytohabitans flavus]|uniref:ATPase AAA n=1 Tax=Phytohabitans flavus TaxID=1076124 RepID=A0A6F8XXG5_9ACTN|nr:MoxR family ATPase [Phytohabitans flavus]BCB78552.1 ATPase AAA [Phytohabitans flavus]
MSDVPGWWIYQGSRTPHDGLDRQLPPPPPWRKFDREAAPVAPHVPGNAMEAAIGDSYRADPETIDLVNAALYLRRPLLVTGQPGTGKSTLATAIAHELKLGKVLRWNITSRTTRQDGLYQYDPMARLHAASRGASGDDEEVGQYVRLGPLGTALLPGARPRVLLIDEMDKSDLDLPNDLLTVFEEGAFEIPELVRQADRYADARVMTADSSERVVVHKGEIRCRDFPVVVMTSNDEREFPPAFLRRCVPVRLEQPDGHKLTEIVNAHLGDDLAQRSADLIDQFLSRDAVATDQLLNAIYLTNHAARMGPINRRKLAGKMMEPLTRRPDDS